MYDEWGRLRMIKDQSSNLVEEYRYNGLNHRLSWHYDTDVDGDCDVLDFCKKARNHRELSACIQLIECDRESDPRTRLSCELQGCYEVRMNECIAAALQRVCNSNGTPAQAIAEINKCTAQGADFRQYCLQDTTPW